MTGEMVRLRCPETVLGWIPWYGETDEEGQPVLTDRERGAVESHAAECPDCRAEIDMIRGAPFEIDCDLPDPDRVFQEITARIESGEAEAVDDRVGPVIPIDRERALGEPEYRKIAHWLFHAEDDAEAAGSDDAGQGGGTLIEGPWARSSLVAAAAAITLFLLGGMVGGFGGAWLSGGMDAASDGGDAAALRAVQVAEATVIADAAEIYELASAPQSLVLDARAAVVEVVFRDAAAASEIARTLRSEGLEIVSGPSSAGVFGLRPVDAVNRGVPDAAAIVRRLKTGSPSVVLYAEPVRAADPLQ